MEHLPGRAAVVGHRPHRRPHFVLKLIEWRWGLQPLTTRDASPQIQSFVSAFNFASPDTTVPPPPVPAPVVAPNSPWAAPARAESVRQWLTHPRFSRQ
jgi:hypothetical protein